MPLGLEVLEPQLLGRFLLATVLGATVGLERELSGKPAGLRTNILICVGAELLTELSLVAAGFATHDPIRSDPARIAAQIVSGIGFIGAGTILVARGNVLGLTTAATLWVVAAIGMAVGLQLYVAAIGATVIVVVILVALGWLERRMIGEAASGTLQVVLSGRSSDPGEVEQLFERMEFDTRRVGHRRRDEEASFRYIIQGPAGARDPLLRELSKMPGVRAARFE